MTLSWEARASNPRAKARLHPRRLRLSRHDRSGDECDGLYEDYCSREIFAWANLNESHASPPRARTAIDVVHVRAPTTGTRIRGLLSASLDSPPRSERIFQPELNLAHREGRCGDDAEALMRR